MHAVVLVGGFGTRLRPLTNDIPKPMLPVGHEPMIVSLVDRLGHFGVTDVVLALGFQPEPFEAAFPGGRYGSTRVHYAVEPEPLDTGGAIAFAARSVGVDDTFLALNGDNICDVDYRWLVDVHNERGRAATIHLTPVADPGSFGVVETDDAGVVQRFVEKPQPGETDSNLVSSGAYVLEPSVLDLIPAGRRVSVERDTFPALVSQGQLDAVSTEDYWTDTGRPELLLAANLAVVAEGRYRRVDPIAPDAIVDPTATVTNTVIGSGASVAAAAEVADSLLLPGAVVESGAVVKSSIVAGRVAADSSVVDSVIGATATAEGVVAAVRMPEPEN